jgi:hypothetical protein
MSNDVNELGCQGRGLKPHTMGGPRDLPRQSCRSSAEINGPRRSESDGESRKVPRLSLIKLPGAGALAERFWSKVDVRGPDECWPWSAGSRGVGYGAIKVAGKVIDAHVIAFELAGNARPLPGIWVTHKCDNRMCCNPKHLVAGTPRDNHGDMVARGRHPWSFTSETVRRKRDEGTLPQAKLTREKADRIRAVWAEGGHTHASLGVLFGVDRSTVGRVVRGDRWIDEPRNARKSA